MRWKAGKAASDSLWGFGKLPRCSVCKYRVSFHRMLGSFVWSLTNWQWPVFVVCPECAGEDCP
jgi:hypothetical protein